MCIVETLTARFTGKYLMDVGQNYVGQNWRWWWNEKTLNIYILTSLLGPFLNYILANLGFWPMRKTNTVIFRKDLSIALIQPKGGGPRVVVSTAAFHARVRGSVPGFGGLKETKLFLPHPRVKVSIVGSLRDREVACSASDRQGSNFESCVWRTVSSQSSHHPQEVLLAQFSLYVHKGGLKPDSFHFIQPKAGPRSSGTLFLVFTYFHGRINNSSSSLLNNILTLCKITLSGILIGHLC